MNRALVAASAAITMVGCGPSKEEQERAAVVARIEAVVAIPARDVESRARAVDALRRTAVTTPDARAARDLCANAFGALAEGMRLTSEAEAGLRPGSGSNPEAAVKAAKDADALLAGVDADLDRCSESSAALRLRR